MTQLATVLASGTDLYKTYVKTATAPKPWVWNSKENTLFNIESSSFYDNNVRLSFTLREAYTNHFIHIKGLLEFNRLTDFQFTYNRNEKTVTLDIPLEKRNALNDLFLLVEKQIREELQFKQYLKQALAFERQYQIEKAKVYHFIPS